jgi:hypothetical protein
LYSLVSDKIIIQTVCSWGSAVGVGSTLACQSLAVPLNKCFIYFTWDRLLLGEIAQELSEVKTFKTWTHQRLKYHVLFLNIQSLKTLNSWVLRLNYKPLTPPEFKKIFIIFDILIANSFKFETFNCFKHESFQLALLRSQERLFDVRIAKKKVSRIVFIDSSNNFQCFFCLGVFLVQLVLKR